MLRQSEDHDVEDKMERGDLNNVEKKPTLQDERDKDRCIFQSPTAATTMTLDVSQEDTVSAKRSWSTKMTNWLPSLSFAKSNHSEESGLSNIIVRRLSDPPRGYPNLACFLDSDEDFMIYRRFGFLQQRILLHKQDELRAMEKQLDRIDEDDALQGARGESILSSRDKDDNTGGPRRQLIRNIQVAFKEYSELMVAARDMMGFGKPTNRDYTSVKNYFDDEAPLVEEECYIYRKEDMITLKHGRENAWLDIMVEKALKKFSCRFLRWLFCSPETRAKVADDKLTVLYTKDRVGCLVTAIITAMILLLLIVPIYLLWHLSAQLQTGYITAVTIGVILVFTLIFSGVLSFFTRARRHEILASAAAYCAVLVVFLGNVGSNSVIVDHLH